jgi:hypothetical protein
MSGMNAMPGCSIASEAGGKDQRSSQSEEPYPRTSVMDVRHGFNLQEKSSPN